MNVHSVCQLKRCGEEEEGVSDGWGKGLNNFVVNVNKKEVNKCDLFFKLRKRNCENIDFDSPRL